MVGLQNDVMGFILPNHHSYNRGFKTMKHGVSFQVSNDDMFRA
jgi:hypothetical protein